MRLKEEMIELKQRQEMEMEERVNDLEQKMKEREQ